MVLPGLMVVIQAAKLKHTIDNPYMLNMTKITSLQYQLAGDSERRCQQHQCQQSGRTREQCNVQNVSRLVYCITSLIVIVTYKVYL